MCPPNRPFRFVILIATFALGVVPTLASARTATVHVGGSVEIALQGPRGHASIVLYPEGVAVTGSTRTTEPAYRDAYDYGHVTHRPVGPVVHQPAPPPERRRARRHARDGRRYVAHHPCGALAVEGRLVRGEAHGVWRWYDRRGRITEERQYHHGVLHGTVRLWHPNGRLAEEYAYRGGLLHGTMRIFHANGRLVEERHYRHDRLHGTVRTWHPNGRLASERHYRHGQPSGRWMTWNPAGRVTTERRYRG